MPDERDKHKPHNKPDDRGDNAQKIQENIDCTIISMEAADEMIARTSNEKTRKDLEDKNHRRQEALKGMRQEMRDEAPHRDKP